MKLTRRTVLGAIGTAGRGPDGRGRRTAPLRSRAPQPIPGDARGRTTGAKAAAKAFRAEGVPCVFGVPGAQNNEFWDAMKSLEVPYLLVAHESAGERDGRRLGPGLGPGRRLRPDPRARG